MEGRKAGLGAGVRNNDSTRYGNPPEYDVDLHSIYAAFLGLFETIAVDWWEKSWGGYFTTFNDFLGFGWEVMVVVDSQTGRPHIAARREQIGLFARMIRTRFGESLPKDPPTTLPLSPVPSRSLSLRRVIVINDLTSYRKLSQTLPAAELSYLRSRVRGGEVEVLEQLFYAGGPASEWDATQAGVRDNGVGYTWACVNTTWWEKGGAPYGVVPGQGRTQSKGPAGKGLPLEVGVAVVRCANLRAVDVWPPTPEENYRKNHYITEEWVDKRTNTTPPSYPRAYAFGKSRYVSERDVEKIVDATLGALSAQENDSNANQLILLSVGEPQPLPVPITSTLPANILQVDILALEFNLLRRAQMRGTQGTPDRRTPLTSLHALLHTLHIPVPQFAPLGNAGNEAFYTVLAFQKLMMAETRLPDMLFQSEGYPYPTYPYVPQPYMPQGPPGLAPRRQSSSSLLRPDARLSTSGSSSRHPDRRASEYTRPRPSSMAEHTPKSSNSGGQPSRPSHMSRSQTVFWDDADFAGDTNAKPTQTSRGNSEDSLRAKRPPTSWRANGESSRSISWEEPSVETGIETPPRTHGSSNASSPRRNTGQHVALSASSLRLADKRLVEEPVALRDTQDQTDRKDGQKEKEKEKGKEKGKEKETEKLKAKESKPKLKTDKSVKDLAGALAKFWVG